MPAIRFLTVSDDLAFIQNYMFYFGWLHCLIVVVKLVKDGLS